MGNGVGKLTVCFSGEAGRKHADDDDDDMEMVVVSDPSDEGLGHSFCYVRPDPSGVSLSKVHSETETTTFRSISGASVSANTSTPLSNAFVDLYSYNSLDRAAAFESSTSFASIPLQPVPRSAPLSMGMGMERGFLSGPIERGFMSGPLDPSIFSGPLQNDKPFRRSFSHASFAALTRSKSKARSFIRVLHKAISNTVSRGHNSIVTPIIKGVFSVQKSDKNGAENLSSGLSLSLSLRLDGGDDDENLHWAQGKAGEDRVHVVISEECGWVFVGIYDGFNGPDAPDYLLSNLYSAVHKEVKGLLWEEDKPTATSPVVNEPSNQFKTRIDQSNDNGCIQCSQPVNSHSLPTDEERHNSNRSSSKQHSKTSSKGAAKKREDSHKRWKCEWDKERLELDRKLKEHLTRSNSKGVATSINHNDVLKALSQALQITEESYLDVADSMVLDNPELALMGSCVLVMLMKGEDVYVMNVGDSRAVLGQMAQHDFWLGNTCHDLEKINEETLHDLESCDGDQSNRLASLAALQLTLDHTTSVEEEARRIKDEHPDDPFAVMNDRVKGSLKVTRAFGAGFLKQPKWNDALLEMFRIDYVGSSPYITCSPSLQHHKLGPKDRFLILSSDGLYQYFTNEEVVSKIELFIALSPDGDPAQHLVEEVLFRAAKKAGLDFHELLEIPQGDRRRYHDDVSIIVISLEGRIWRSCL